MLPVVLSIALLVLLSVAVIAVVADEGKTQPTSGRPLGGGSEPPEPDTSAGATVAALPEPTPAAVDPPPEAVADEPAGPAITLPRHRFRSSVLLVLYVLVAGVLMASAIGAVAAGLTLLLRDVVTS